MATLAIEARNLTHRFGQRTVLSGLDLEVEPGVIVGLFGPNGAGKTTTFRILTGLVSPVTGSVTLLGRSIPEALPQVGVMMEQPAFYPNMSALGNLEFALACSGQRMSRAEKVALLERVGLGGARGPVRGFSLGMRRRLALAVALSKSPGLLVFDEPTNGLDLNGVELMCNLIQECAHNGTACLMISHDCAVAERLVSKVVILDNGQTRYNGTLAHLITPEDQWRMCCRDERAELLLRQIPGVTVLQAGPGGDYVLDLARVPVTAVMERLASGGCFPEVVAPVRKTFIDVYRAMIKGGIE